MTRTRPGIAKAPPLPPERGEGREGTALVRAVLSELQARISNEAPTRTAAFVWGTWELGGARLVPGSVDASFESLRVSWNRNEIEKIEIESRHHASFCGPESPADSSGLLDRLIPMLWTHIRRGGSLPPGIDRFARLL